jgi:hypothetical protein
MRWVAQFFQAAEASQPGGIADKFAQTPVIGMLIFNQTLDAFLYQFSRLCKHVRRSFLELLP